MSEINPVLRVCSLLNGQEAKYFIIGGQAIIIHGLVRTTEDVDIPQPRSHRRDCSAQDAPARECGTTFHQTRTKVYSVPSLFQPLFALVVPLLFLIGFRVGV